MTIEAELNALDNTKAAIKQAIIDKGVSVPSNTSFSEYPSKIAQIETGIIKREVNTGVLQVPASSYAFVLPEGVYDLGNRALNTSYHASTGITSADMSTLTNVKGLYAAYKCFENCTNLTTLDLSNLRSISNAEVQTGPTTNEGVDDGINWDDLENLLNGESGSSGSGSSSEIIRPPHAEIGNMSAGGTGSLAFTCNGCTSLATVDLSSLKYVLSTEGLNGTFQGCTSLTSISFPELEVLEGMNSMTAICKNCTGLTSASFAKLHTTRGTYSLEEAFYGCSNLTSVSFPELVTVGNSSFRYTFRGCTSLTSVTFPKVSNIPTNNPFRYTFQGCSSLTSISFPSLNAQSFGTYTNQFNQMLYGCSNVTVHFPSNLQSVIGSWSDVTAGFGGTNTTILYDLPATVALKIVFNSYNSSWWLPHMYYVNVSTSMMGSGNYSNNCTVYDFITLTTTEAEIVLSVPKNDEYMIVAECDSDYVLSFQSYEAADSNQIWDDFSIGTSDTTINIYIDQPSSGSGEFVLD